MRGNMRNIVNDEIYKRNCMYTTESHEPNTNYRYY